MPALSQPPPGHRGKRLRLVGRSPDYRRRRCGPLGSRCQISEEGRRPRAAVPLIMQRCNRQASAASSSSVPPGLATSLDKQPAWRRWFAQNIVYNTLLKWPIASQISQWKDLSNSDLDWTMVMPPMLTNAPAHGTYRIDGDALPSQRQPHLARRCRRLHDAADRQPAVDQERRVPLVVGCTRNSQFVVAEVAPGQ